MMDLLPAVSWPLEQIWDTALGFVAMVVLLLGFVGATSRSLAVGALAAYAAFIYYATYTDLPFLTEMLYVSLMLVVIGLAFKLWRLELGGEPT